MFYYSLKLTSMKKTLLSIILIILSRTLSLACTEPWLKNQCIEVINGVPTITFDVSCYDPTSNPTSLWYKIGGTTYGPVSPSYTAILGLNGVWHYTYTPSAPAIPENECIEIYLEYFTAAPPNSSPSTNPIMICPCGDIPCDASITYSVNGTDPYTYTFDAINRVSWLGYKILFDFPAGSPSCPSPYTSGFCTLPVSYTYTPGTTHTVCMEAYELGGIDGCISCINICVPKRPEIQSRETGNETTNLFPITTFSNIKLYPNPTYDVSVLSFYLSKSGHIKIELYDVFGRLVKNIKNEALIDGVQEIMINTAELASGIYIIKVSDNREMFSQRLSVIK